MYSNDGDVHFFAEYSPMILKDTLYEAKAEYVKNFKLPQTDSIIRSQTYHIRKIIEQNGNEIGILYYTTSSDLLQNAEGHFFIKNNNIYIELFNVSFILSKLQEVNQLLSTIKI